MNQPSIHQTNTGTSRIIFLSLWGALRIILTEIGLFVFHTIKATIWLIRKVFRIAQTVSNTFDDIRSEASRNESGSSSSSSSSSGSTIIPPIANIKEDRDKGYIECYDIYGSLYKKIYIAEEFIWAAVKSDLIVVHKEDGTYDIYDLYGHYVENRRYCP